MAHEPHCNCCGCSQLRILDAGFIESLSTTGKFVDYPTSSPTEVTVVDAGWQFIGGRLVGGKSKLDLSASQVSIVGGYVPLLRRGASYVYQSGNPPQQSELQATASVSLYDNTEATFTAELIEREIPQGNADVWVIGYQEGQSFSAATTGPGLLEPGRFAYGWRENKYWYGTPFYRGLYQVNIQAAVSPQFDYKSPSNPYPSGAEQFLVSAFFDLPETAGVSAGKNLPAHAGTPLSEFKSRSLEGIESLVVFSETLSLFDGVAGGYGWTVREPQPNWQGTDPPILVGYDLKLSLSLGSGELLVVTARPSGGPLPLRAAIGCLAQQNGENLPTQGFFTAWVDRGSALGGTATPAHRTVTIYRNGGQVFSANNPTSQQLNAVYEQDGVYLTVTEVDDRSAPAWTHPYPNARRNGPRMLKDYSSSVTDSVRPVVGFTPPNDAYDLLPYFPTGRLLSTEPLISVPAWRDMIDEDQSSVLTRPVGNVQFKTTSGATSYSAPGTYTLRAFGPTEHFDVGGNYPERVPTVQWTAHPLPAGALIDYPEIGHLGATPQLEDPGLRTREYWRPRLDTERVSSLLLTFDLPVNAEQVSANQLTLTRDGELVGGCSMQQVGDNRWRIDIPTAGQTPRTFWMLTYNPGGVVFRNDPIPEERYAKRSDFPATGEPRKIYIHPDSGGSDVRFYWGRAAGGSGAISYIQISHGQPPRDIYGVAFEPEPSVLAARVGWLMADMNGYPRAIDTSSIAGPYQIGRIASVHSSDLLDTEKNKSAIGITGGFFLSHNQALGSYSPLVNYEGYTPSVPTLTSPPDDCSYFGLTTTIDPCPPANVSPCASPKIAQKHASAIRCDGDINAIQVSLVAIDENGQPANLSSEKFVLTNQNNAYNGDIDFSVNQDTLPPAGQGNGVAMFLMAKSGQPYTFEKTLGGMDLCQNVWSCVDGARSAEMQLRESRSRKADATSSPRYRWKLIDGQEVFDSPGWLASFQNDYEISEALIALTVQDQSEESIPTFVRGNSNGIVRSLSGSIKQLGAQGCASAYRAHATFPSLQTTTLGELCISLSFRVAMEATVQYQDTKVKPKLWWAQLSWPTFGSTFGTFQEVQAVSVSRTGVESISGIAYCSLAEGEPIASKTVTHQFLADVSDTLVLSKEQEETLATGGEVLIKAAGGPAISYWKIKKG